MNQLVIAVLIIFGLTWLLYIAGLRNKRIAFTLWFPLTATSFLGTLPWLWSALALLFSGRAQGEAEGWMVYGAAIFFGTFLICPIVFALSLWQRPKAGSYGLTKTLPIIALYFALGFLYRPLSEIIENQKLQLIVLDANKGPLVHAKVEYETNQKTFQFAFPTSSENGEIETGSDGTVMLPVPKTHELDCTVSMEGYAILRVHMDRSWGQLNWHQTTIDWRFPAGSVWQGQGGRVQTDVDNTTPMHLTVYLPKINAEIPSYGPFRIYHEEQKPGQWTSEPSKINYY